MYKVYIRTDEYGNITEIDSSAFIEDISGWTEIDEGYGDRYHHAQGHYFPEALMTEEAKWRYKYVDGKVSENA